MQRQYTLLALVLLMAFVSSRKQSQLLTIFFFISRCLLLKEPHCFRESETSAVPCSHGRRGLPARRRVGEEGRSEFAISLVSAPAVPEKETNSESVQCRPAPTLSLGFSDSAQVLRNLAVAN